MDILERLRWRYATKKFDNDAFISEEQMDRIKEGFNLTATSYGLQPLKLLVIKDKQLQAELVQFSMGQEQVAQASHVLVFCIDTKIDSEYIGKHFDRVQEIRNTPEEILKPFEENLIESFSLKTDEALQNWATKQAYLAMGNLLTILAYEGIDACPMEGFNPDDYDRVLDLQSKNLKSVLVMPIGFRAEDDMFSSFKKVRKRMEDVVIHL